MSPMTTNDVDISAPTQIICQRTPPEENATLMNRFKNRVHDLTHASMEQHKVCFQEFYRAKVEKTSNCWNKMIGKISGAGTEAVGEKQPATIDQPSFIRCAEPVTNTQSLSKQ